MRLHPCEKNDRRDPLYFLGIFQAATRLSREQALSHQHSRIVSELNRLGQHVCKWTPILQAMLRSALSGSRMERAGARYNVPIKTAGAEGILTASPAAVRFLVKHWEQLGYAMSLDTNSRMIAEVNPQKVVFRHTGVGTSTHYVLTHRPVSCHGQPTSACNIRFPMTPALFSHQ